MSYTAKQLIDQLKTLADPARLRVVMLCAQGECSVSELTRILGLSQPRVSQHLKQLCDAGLLERFRDGHFVFYRVMSGGRQAALRRKLLAASILAQRGRTREAAARMHAALPQFEAAGMMLDAAIARRARGVLEGGSNGHALVALADEWLLQQGARAPERLAALFVPGLFAE